MQEHPFRSPLPIVSSPLTSISGYTSSMVFSCYLAAQLFRIPRSLAQLNRN